MISLLSMWNERRFALLFRHCHCHSNQTLIKNSCSNCTKIHTQTKTAFLIISWYGAVRKCVRLVFVTKCLNGFHLQSDAPMLKPLCFYAVRSDFVYLNICERIAFVCIFFVIDRELWVFVHVYMPFCRLVPCTYITEELLRLWHRNRRHSRLKM